jgi:hypothetical protein
MSPRWLAVLLVIGCKGKEASPPSTNPPTAPPPAPGVAVPPPTGTVLPTVGKPREVRDGGGTASYHWMAVWEVDPADPAVKRVLAEEAKQGMTIDPGDAGARLYQQQIEGAGIQIQSSGYGFTYYIQDGAEDVTVRPDDQYHRDDPNGFTIFVGPAGG